MADAQIKAVITAEDKASSVLRDFGKSVDNGVTNALEGARAGSFALLGGLTALAGGAYLTVKAFSESENMAAQLDAVLKSTGGAAGVTRDEALSLSQALQSQTTFSDEAVLSAENLLLTFTSIGKDIFPQATQTVLDMSIALGQDTKSSAIQLGKALQDPILGVTALRRVGVNFSEAQQDVIKNLAETGRSAEAQQLILQELNKEFGGSATAAAATFTGQLKQLWNMINDVMEIIGKIIADAIRPFIQSLMDTFKALGGAEGVGRLFVDMLKTLQPYLPVIVGAIMGGLVPAFVAIISALGLLNPWFLAFVAVGAAVGFVVQQIVNYFGGWNQTMAAIMPPLQQFGSMLMAIVKPALDIIVNIFRDQIIPFYEAHRQQLMYLAQVVLVAFAAAILATVAVITVIVVGIVQLIGAVISVINWFSNLNSMIRGTILGLWGAVAGAFSSFGSNVTNWASGVVSSVVSIFQSLPGRIGGIISGISSSALGSIKGAMHDAHIPGFAGGVQNFSGGLAVVGERGPELVNLPRGSDVIPNNQIGSSSNTTVNISLNGPFMGSGSEARAYAQMIVDNIKDIASSKNMTVAQVLG